MVGIVKWLRQWIVAPLCVGSNPTIHPTFIKLTMGYRQVVRQWILTPSCAGSNPASLVSSSLPSEASLSFKFYVVCAVVAELAYALD